MKRHNDSEDRNELRIKMAKVLENNIQMLSQDMQRMLLDDLVTAFDNRVKVLVKSQDNVAFEAAQGVECETVQA